jgi:hypothetical protein
MISKEKDSIEFSKLITRNLIQNELDNKILNDLHDNIIFNIEKFLNDILEKIIKLIYSENLYKEKNLAKKIYPNLYKPENKIQEYQNIIYVLNLMSYLILRIYDLCYILNLSQIIELNRIYFNWWINIIILNFIYLKKHIEDIKLQNKFMLEFIYTNLHKNFDCLKDNQKYEEEIKNIFYLLENFFYFKNRMNFELIFYIERKNILEIELEKDLLFYLFTRKKINNIAEKTYPFREINKIKNDEEKLTEGNQLTFNFINFFNNFDLFFKNYQEYMTFLNEKYSKYPNNKQILNCLSIYEDLFLLNFLSSEGEDKINFKENFFPKLKKNDITNNIKDLSLSKQDIECNKIKYSEESLIYLLFFDKKKKSDHSIYIIESISFLSNKNKDIKENINNINNNNNKIKLGDFNLNKFSENRINIFILFLLIKKLFFYFLNNKKIKNLFISNLKSYIDIFSSFINLKHLRNLNSFDNKQEGKLNSLNTIKQNDNQMNIYLQIKIIKLYIEFKSYNNSNINYFIFKKIQENDKENDKENYKDNYKENDKDNYKEFFSELLTLIDYINSKLDLILSKLKNQKLTTNDIIGLIRDEFNKNVK